MTDQPDRAGPPGHSTVKGINHVGLSVSDLKASVSFYTGATTVKAEYSKRLSNSAAEKASAARQEPVDRVALTGPNGQLELSQYDSSLAGPPEAIPVKGPGITHVCYQAPTSRDLYARFRALGATPVSRGTEPISLLGRGVSYAYHRDADGIMFETEHLDQAHFEGPIWISHLALVSHDLDKLVDFYGNLLGHEPNRRSNRVSGPAFDEVADYDDTRIRAAWFDTSNMTLELWQFTNPVTPEPGAPIPFERIGYNKFAFEVSDIDHDYRRLVDAGVQFLSEPVQTNESTEVYARDPDGNLFSLIEPAPGSSTSIGTLKARHQ